MEPQPLAGLRDKSFPEPRWCIPGIVPEGLTLLCGPPKIGKSWMSLDWSLAVALGRPALGCVPVEGGSVLLLALEDSERRLFERATTLLGNADWPKPIGYVCQGMPGSNVRLPGLRQELDRFLDRNAWVRMVVIDVFARIRPLPSEGRSRSSMNAFQQDYQAAQEVKDLADRHHLAVVVLHHLRKMPDPDFVSEISGTNGLAAAADTIAVLKRARTQTDAELWLTGRDIEERTLAVHFDAGRWALVSVPRSGGNSGWTSGVEIPVT
jgi:RecA-family ATPase